MPAPAGGTEDGHSGDGYAKITYVASADEVLVIEENTKIFWRGHTYQVFLAANLSITTWDAARDYCEGQGGHLATLTSAEESDVVYNYLFKNRSGSRHTFFGLSDEAEEGTWVWENNEGILGKGQGSSFQLEPGMYSNFGTGEPNNNNDTEDWAAFSFGGAVTSQWNDANFGESGYTIAFICEWE